MSDRFNPLLRMLQVRIVSFVGSFFKFVFLLNIHLEGLKAKTIQPSFLSIPPDL